MIAESKICDKTHKTIEGKAHIIIGSFTSALDQCRTMRIHVLTLDKSSKIENVSIQSMRLGDLKKYWESLANVSQEHRSKAVRHLLDDLNPRTIGLQVATAIDQSIKAAVKRYEELLCEISDANPSHDLVMYELPEVQAIAFSKTTKAHALEPFQDANRLGMYISSIHETLSANYVQYTGDSAKNAIQEKRDASVLRKLRPFLRAVSPHPLISAAIQNGTDLFVDHKVNQSIAKYRIIYTETLTQYFVGYIKFIEAIEQAIPASVDLVTKKVQSICVNAPLDIIENTIASGGVDPYAQQFNNNISAANERYKEPKNAKNKAAAVIIIPILFILFAIFVVIYLRTQHINFT